MVSEPDLSRFSMDWGIETYRQLKARERDSMTFCGTHGPMVVTKADIWAETARRSPELLEVLAHIDRQDRRSSVRFGESDGK